MKLSVHTLNVSAQLKLFESAKFYIYGKNTHTYTFIYLNRILFKICICEIKYFALLHEIIFVPIFIIKYLFLYKLKRIIFHELININRTFL